ncbi:UDP-N-acetylmuramate dehydrogenase [uncultured Brachyspira sp.]|uniref:UDP-N-acetylmuramate dehydrogenase n=1 Tax=uncultured Brachyspira sp. TaxID=221953 RepID=UPI0026275102|nr:UDP-N-acetylmuramate dehydrogenase [uncultured Brachyspira sp.]
MSMQNNYQAVEKFLNDNNIEYYVNHPFNKFSSFSVGGNVDLFIIVKEIKSFLELVSFLYNNNIDYFVMRDANRVLVSDDGYRGIMISMEGEFENFEFLDNGILKANASAILERLSHEARIRNLSGLEFLALVNSRVGSAIYEKLESFGMSLMNIVKNVTIIDKKTAEVKEISTDEYVSMTEEDKNNIVILSIIFKLENDNPESIDNRIDWYRYIRGSVAPMEANIGPVFEDFGDVKAYEMVERVGGLDMKYGAMIWHKRFPNYIINNCINSNEDNNEICRAIDVINLIEDTRKKIEQHYDINPKINITLLV